MNEIPISQHSGRALRVFVLEFFWSVLAGIWWPSSPSVLASLLNLFLLIFPASQFLLIFPVKWPHFLLSSLRFLDFGSQNWFPVSLPQALVTIYDFCLESGPIHLLHSKYPTWNPDFSFSYLKPLLPDHDQ